MANATRAPMQIDRRWSSHSHRPGVPTKSLIRWGHKPRLQTEATPSSPILERSDAPADFEKKTMIRQKKHLVSFRIEKSYSTRNDPKTLKSQWIGFRASLNGKLQKPWSMVFTSKHRSFHFRFSLERFEQSQCPKIRQGNVRIQRDVNPWLDCYVISDFY